MMRIPKTLKDAIIFCWKYQKQYIMYYVAPEWNTDALICLAVKWVGLSASVMD